eukprot:CAMPEP_0117572840 /NCGR_PEP_ID=MMETSP0784-20121206/60581_1 /TAXON_ID=39447 /ORGANISM="" /LENGTH=322 /DNA_ID=CAMNT_0005371257 /DNA_START=12 /DNA_END=980 /DNA_ORIENTATION=-
MDEVSPAMPVLLGGLPLGAGAQAKPNAPSNDASGRTLRPNCDAEGVSVDVEACEMDDQLAHELFDCLTRSLRADDEDAQRALSRLRSERICLLKRLQRREREQPQLQGFGGEVPLRGCGLDVQSGGFSVGDGREHAIGAEPHIEELTIEQRLQLREAQLQNLRSARDDLVIGLTGAGVSDGSSEAGAKFQLRALLRYVKSLEGVLDSVKSPTTSPQKLERRASMPASTPGKGPSPTRFSWPTSLGDVIEEEDYDEDRLLPDHGKLARLHSRAALTEYPEDDVSDDGSFLLSSKRLKLRQSRKSPSKALHNCNSPSEGAECFF